MTRALLLLGVLFSGVAHAAPAPDGKAEVRYQPVTKYDFDNDNVEGTLPRPDDVLVDGRLRAGHESLIQPRRDFVPELIKSAEHL